jgi:hypothetical protein
MYTSQKHYYGDQIKVNETGGHTTCMGKMQTQFYSGNLKGREYWDMQVLIGT